MRDDTLPIMIDSLMPSKWNDQLLAYLVRNAGKHKTRNTSRLCLF